MSFFERMRIPLVAAHPDDEVLGCSDTIAKVIPVVVKASDTYPLSVVIPTLGCNSLINTLNVLNVGSKVPAEIIVCIPEQEAEFLPQLPWANVKVLKTSVRGQVAQRAEGFNQVNQPYVMQLDDDVQISSESMQHLINELTRLGIGSAVAPIYLDERTGKCIHRHPVGLRGILSNLSGVIFSGAPWGKKRIGCITPSGTNYGVDVNQMEEDVMQVEWAPGGCLMHHSESLCTENFFPFPGKAYCEDLIHSHILRQKKVELYVVKAATSKIENPDLPKAGKELNADMRARLYFNQLRGVPLYRFYIWQVITYMKSIIFSIFWTG